MGHGRPHASQRPTGCAGDEAAFGGLGGPGVRVSRGAGRLVALPRRELRALACAAPGGARRAGAWGSEGRAPPNEEPAVASCTQASEHARTGGGRAQACIRRAQCCSASGFESGAVPRPASPVDARLHPAQRSVRAWCVGSVGAWLEESAARSDSGAVPAAPFRDGRRPFDGAGRRRRARLRSGSPGSGRHRRASHRSAELSRPFWRGTASRPASTVRSCRLAISAERRSTSTATT
jgi:hypothetical protein